MPTVHPRSYRLLGSPDRGPRKAPSAKRLRTVVHDKAPGAIKYVKPAGFAGRTAGLGVTGEPDHLEDSAH